MILETERTYELVNELSDLNENNLLKPHGYQKLFVELGDRHLDKIDINVDTTMESNLAWAFISISIEIVKPIEGITRLIGKTWHSGRRGPFYRREYLFTDEKGEILIKGASFSVLLDMDKRTVYRKRETPFYISDPIEDHIIEAKPNNKINLDFTKIDERIAYNSYIDCLGHVNNTRYGEFAYDTFTDSEVDNLVKLKRMDIYFKSELRKNDSFSTYKANKENQIYIRGVNDSKDDSSFDIIFTF